MFAIFISNYSFILRGFLHISQKAVPVFALCCCPGPGAWALAWLYCLFISSLLLGTGSSKAQPNVTVAFGIWGNLIKSKTSWLWGSPFLYVPGRRKDLWCMKVLCHHGSVAPASCSLIFLSTILKDLAISPAFGCHDGQSFCTCLCSKM